MPDPTTTAPASGGQPQPWEKLPEESVKAHAAFVAFRDLPPQKRSIAEAYRTSRKAVKRDGTRVTKPPGIWRTWHQRNAWADRAEAYDAHMAVVAQQAREQATASEATEWAKRAESVPSIEWEVGHLMLEAAKNQAKRAMGGSKGSLVHIAATAETGSRLLRRACRLPIDPVATAPAENLSDLFFESAGEMAGALPAGAAQPMPADVVKTPEQLGVTAAAAPSDSVVSQDEPKRPK